MGSAIPQRCVSLVEADAGQEITQQARLPKIDPAIHANLLSGKVVVDKVG
jgi:hypothetical protein